MFVSAKSSDSRLLRFLCNLLFFVHLYANEKQTRFVTLCSIKHRELLAVLSYKLLNFSHLYIIHFVILRDKEELTEAVNN